MKTVRKILQLNEIEGRTVSMEEIQRYLYKQSAAEREREYQMESLAILEDIASNLAHSLEALFEDDKEKNNIHKAIEREKWQRIKNQLER
jgi:hypothetical protein